MEILIEVLKCTESLRTRGYEVALLKNSEIGHRKGFLRETINECKKLSIDCKCLLREHFKTN